MLTKFRFVLILLVVIEVPAAWAQSPKFSAPKDYLLVLGDSLAFGYQRPKFLMTQNPAAFTTGFADNFVARLRATRPGRDTNLVNLAGGVWLHGIRTLTPIGAACSQGINAWR
jgi:hypothetical protein